MLKLQSALVTSAFLASAGCAAMDARALPQFPALVEPASQEHHVGKVMFLELVTPDLAAAKRFYAGLFGWTFRDLHKGRTQYVEASLDGHPIAGMVYRDMPRAEPRRPAWLTFISVRDVDAARGIAVKQGAKVLFEPHDIPARGREAVFTDPQGAMFAVVASSSGDSPDTLPRPGEWMWSSLIANNADADAAFYQTLFGYEVFDVAADEGSQHLLLASDNYARASANTPPANKPSAHPHWLNYVRVDDAVAMAAKVVALGGRVLVAPQIDRHGGKVAVVADPQGAPFGLLEWSETDSQEVAQ
jgi:predicted enzyme related to lactoylglutathione lyase